MTLPKPSISVYKLVFVMMVAMVTITVISYDLKFSCGLMWSLKLSCIFTQMLYIKRKSDYLNAKPNTYFWQILQV